jgi:hypothetical protein
MRSHWSTARCPPAAASAVVRSPQGQPAPRAHSRLSNRPVRAAPSHTHRFQGQPLVRSHCRTSRRPDRAAAAQAPASQGHPRERAHLSTGSGASRASLALRSRESRRSDGAGFDWPQRGRSAAHLLHTARRPVEPSQGVTGEARVTKQGWTKTYQNRRGGGEKSDPPCPAYIDATFQAGRHEVGMRHRPCEVLP